MSDAGECVRCHARLLTLAAYCSRCGLVVARSAHALVPADLRRIADGHRTLMRVFALFLLVQIGIALQIGYFSPYWVFGMGVLWVGLVIFLMLSVLSLSNALHFGVIASLFLTLLCLVPVVNLFVVLWLGRRAALELRVAGIRVRFLGARKGDVDLIAYVHRCRSCGYDLRGLTSLKCPECGTAFAAPAIVSAS